MLFDENVSFGLEQTRAPHPDFGAEAWTATEALESLSDRSLPAG